MKKKHLAIGLLLCSLLFSCHHRPSPAPYAWGWQTGDLVFVSIPWDYTLSDDTLQDSIRISDHPTQDPFNFIHVAVADVQDGNIYIIDATLKRGTARYPLDTFLRDFSLKDGSLPNIEVMRLKDATESERFVSRARALCGRAFDIDFQAENQALYCSELVRNAYVSSQGDTLFEAVNLDFASPDGRLPLYWKQIFEYIGREIPQGKYGLLPQALYHSPKLEKVDNPHDR